MKNKFKMFIENIFIYGLGGAISKIIPLIMLPIISYILPSSDYFGISDMFNTVVGFAASVALIGAYDAMYRLFFEKDDEAYKISVCSTTLVFTFITSIFVLLMLLLFRNSFSKIFLKDYKYNYIIVLAAFGVVLSVLNTIIVAPSRMQNRPKEFITVNILGTVIFYVISIPLLLLGFYIIALPVASLISSLFMAVVFFFINKKWFAHFSIDTKILKQILIIGIPLMPNFLIYWVFNSFDKLMITHFLGLGETGIYSIASKIGQISQLIYVAFGGGWQFFAFSTMKEKNQIKSNSDIFEYVAVFSFAITSYLCAFSYLIFRFFFSTKYLSGYVVAPYLFLAPLLQMLFQVAANQFLIIKKTWPNLFILSSGAVINIILNLFLIPRYGIEGAAISTIVGYIASDILCVAVLSYMKLMIITKRLIASISLMSIFTISWRLIYSKQVLVGTACSIILTFFLILLYRNEIIKLIMIVRRKGDESVPEIR